VTTVQIRIEASDFPGRSCGPSPDSPGGYHNIHVGVQRRSRRDELLGLVPGDSPSATWSLDCNAVRSATGVDLTGRYIQGPPGGRFIYLSWGTSTTPGPSRSSGGRSSGSMRSHPPSWRVRWSRACSSGGSDWPIAKPILCARPCGRRW